MYDRFPCVELAHAAPETCVVGWTAIGERLRSHASHARPKARVAGRDSDSATIVCVECYPGVFVDDVTRALTSVLAPALVVRAEDCYLPPTEVDRRLARCLTEDPVFGKMNDLTIDDFLAPEALAAARASIAAVTSGMVLVLGTGAVLIAPKADVLVLSDLARWEIQQRQRRGEITGLGTGGRRESPSQLYKRGFFVDWRAADRLKRKIMARVDFFLDTHESARPKLVLGSVVRDGLAATVRRPFRVVPFFDPGPWGGQWMRRVCRLDGDAPNYAWCFDCVPEENSLLLGIGGERIEVPSVNLVFAHPRELLGDAVHARFGAEFPIRFDFLYTMDGGNLSFQVHPLTEYIQEHFGVHYTQDESYYVLDAKPDACVFLGLKEGVDREAMTRDLRRADGEKVDFPILTHANRWLAKKHDHFLIPAGTTHCSGKNTMVLEISATPYIFTFKLWDWGRMGLDGKPRPVHLDHGIANVDWNRTTAWVEANLINRIEPTAHGDGWREERTGLHEREFIETRRHWFTRRAPHDSRAGVEVLNLVEGDEAVVESPTGAFDPFVLHYAETFIVPAAVGPYTIAPHGASVGRECATIKAFVRTSGHRV
jgi:mannose-6-phosphate isomerase class I